MTHPQPVEADKPIARVVSAHGDPETFGERLIDVLVNLSSVPYDTDLFPLSSLTSRDERIAVAEAENAKLRALSEEAIRLMTKYAREAGEATGKLETSELAGVVDDWKARALKAEARLAEAVGALEAIRKIKAEPIADTGFETGPLAHFNRAKEIARQALSSVGEG